MPCWKAPARTVRPWTLTPSHKRKRGGREERKRREEREREKGRGKDERRGEERRAQGKTGEGGQGGQGGSRVPWAKVPAATAQRRRESAGTSAAAASASAATSAVAASAAAWRRRARGRRLPARRARALDATDPRAFRGPGARPRLDWPGREPPARARKGTDQRRHPGTDRRPKGIHGGDNAVLPIEGTTSSAPRVRKRPARVRAPPAHTPTDRQQPLGH